MLVEVIRALINHWWYLPTGTQTSASLFNRLSLGLAQSRGPVKVYRTNCACYFPTLFQRTRQSVCVYKILKFASFNSSGLSGNINEQNGYVRIVITGDHSCLLRADPASMLSQGNKNFLHSFQRHLKSEFLCEMLGFKY